MGTGRAAWCTAMSLAFGASCSITPLDYEGRACTDRCPSPYACVAGKCTRAADAGRADSSTTASDGGGGDASSIESAYRAAVMSDGPIAYFRFDDDPGATTARNEVAGSPIAGTYAGAIARGAQGPLGNEPKDKAVTVSGDGRLELGDVLETLMQSPTTIELWALVTTAGPGNRFLFSRRSMQAPRFASLFFNAGGTVEFERADPGGGTDGVYPNVELTTNTWHHLVVTSDGQRMRMYFDGARAGQSGGITLTFSPEPVSVQVGNRFQGGGDSSMAGSFDELAIYDKALTDTNVRAHWTASGR